MNWWKPNPMDEPARRREFRRFADRSPYMLAPCAAMVAFGSWYELLPLDKAVICSLAGLVIAWALVVSFQPGGAQKFRTLILFSPAVYGLVLPRHTGDLPWLTVAGMVAYTIAYAMACKWGTTFLLFYLFREPFLHYVETPAVRTVVMDHSAEQPSGVPVQEFDY